MPAERAYQALRGEAVDSRSNEVVRHTHLEQPRNAGSGAVGVQGRQYKMTGERCVHGDLGRLSIPDLAYHDNVRIAAQGRAEHLCEGQADALLYLGLVDAVQQIFHRILYGENFALDAV